MVIAKFMLNITAVTAVFAVAGLPGAVIAQVAFSLHYS
jgi:hypothetical protein